MAILNSETTQKAVTSFSNLPITRQVGLFVGLAASVAIGVAVVLWSQEPNYFPVFNDTSSPEASEIIDVLEKGGIEFKLDHQKGTIMVSADDIYQARIKLSAEGLPRTKGQGIEFIGKEQGFGSSQFMEAARYKYALEADLTRTIASFQNIKSARVHLALPKQAVFVRDRQKSSASVFVDLYGGTQLSASQVSSIIHLVASSIPDMRSEDVTVVDQKGNLLTDGNGTDSLAVADRQLNYKKQLEDMYSKKIDEILSPVLGVGKVKARVTADVDFTSSEQTQELFNPKQMLRSEQVMEEKRVNDSGSSGVPGALSNKPPSKAELQKEKQKEDPNAEKDKKIPTDSKKQATKNYELDKTISHTQQYAGRIKRLNVAVVLDNRVQRDPKTGKTTTVPLTKEEIAQFSSIVKNAIGFDEKRGDSVDLINSAFIVPDTIEDIPAMSFWEKPWVWDLAKQVAGGLFVLLMIFGVIRPILRSLASRPVEDATLPLAGPGGARSQGGVGPDGSRLPGPLQTYEDRMSVVQNMAEKDPKRVAQVVKTWVDKS